MSSVLEQPPVAVQSSPLETPYLFSVEEFYRMVEQDIFPDDVRVGLWDGRVYHELAKQHAHSYSCAGLVAVLLPVLPAGWSLWPECSLTLSADKAPVPDIIILRGVYQEYQNRRPTALDIGLIIELADTSLKIDTGAKLKGYAIAGIPVYWVVNLKDNVIHVYADPITSEGRYASITTIGRDGSIPFILGGTQVALIAASGILPKP